MKKEEILILKTYDIEGLQAILNKLKEEKNPLFENLESIIYSILLKNNNGIKEQLKKFEAV